MDGLGYSCHLEPVPWVLVLLSVLVFINMHLCFQLLSTASGIQGWPAGASGERGGGNSLQPPFPISAGEGWGLSLILLLKKRESLISSFVI